MDCILETIGFIGGGNMARALATCFIEKGIVDAKKIWVSSRTENTLQKWIPLGVNTTLVNGEVIKKSNVVFLTIKPQVLDAVIEDVCQFLESKTYLDKVFVSVLAGIPITRLKLKLEEITINPRIVRAMPNTPVTLGEGIIVYCLDGTNSSDGVLIEKLFSCTGLTEIVPESLINALSALCGSGPAFAYLMIEALSDGAVKMGVPRGLATKFSSQVLIGAGKMVQKTEKHPGQLKDEVCSPGGTTICGMHELENGSVRASIINAIEATVKKADSLAPK
ncbi:pyrroline-5-carboxylate reductase 1, mitochondrial [Leptopilina boulardi]|uniref:pyrroline-5-carboxylate reductase 1, mitochondrial n=1 Tax=Leptopilina boulardi TaxID=63433 RepID=UPI0021F64339|nr:pyrroline-5-carboxylate reductase 1, mitochondrial [Leptopilina boulardi]